MNKCPICEKDADKLNAHLVPWFLIKNAITQSGSGIRDMELSFTIDTQNFTKIYPGRSILPEKLEEFGELSELQKEKDNPYSRDNLICIKCEEKFSRLEAIFASQFSEKRIAAAGQDAHININGFPLMIDAKYHYSLFQLFVQSIFYRCSIGRFDGFVLDNRIEGMILDNIRCAFLTGDFNKIKPLTAIYIPHYFPIVVTRFLNEKDSDPTSNFIVVTSSKFPYFIFAANWTFQLFEKRKQLKNPVQWLFGLSQVLNAESADKKIGSNSHLIIIDPNTGKNIAANIKVFFVEKKIQGIRKKIRELYEHIFHTKGDAFTLDYIYNRFFHHFNNKKSDFESMVNAFLDLKLL
jgi:hypothetical protein